MIATGGFGSFPNNPLTQTFQDVVSKNVSAEYLDPFNSYMENISAPTIQPQLASGSGNDSSLDPVGTLVEVFTGETAPVVEREGKRVLPLHAVFANFPVGMFEVVWPRI